MTFSLNREPHELVRRTITVLETRRITPDYVRVKFTGDELAGFASTGNDDHLRIFFGEESREYTPAAWGENWLELEFVLHAGGVASDWAEKAKPGDVVSIGGPRGSLALEGAPEEFVLAGDLTALPAMRRFAHAAAKSAARLTVIIQGSIGDEVNPPEGATVHTVKTVDELVAALASLPAPSNTAETLVFVAAEQSVVKPAREIVLAKWGVPDGHAIIKGYWKTILEES